MTRVGNVDQVLLLLREQLQRAGHGRGSQRAAQSTRPAAARPIERARALAALDALSEEDVRRAVLRGLLTEELGEELGADPGFQGVIDDVFRIIADMPGGTELIDRAIARLRGG